MAAARQSALSTTEEVATPSALRAAKLVMSLSPCQFRLPFCFDGSMAAQGHPA